MRAASTQRGLRRELLVFALFVVLTVLHTWPLATAPGRWSRNDNGDVVLNEWALAWVAHQVVTDPVHLFDGNIFYPDRRTLAYSEHLVPQAAMVAPLLWGGASPVLAHNVALLIGFALTAWAMCFVVARWTGCLSAGLVAGSLAAFNAHTLTRLAHLQAQHVEFLPLGLLALDQVLAEPRLRSGVRTGVWFGLQALTSGYFLMFSVLAAGVSVAVRPAEWLGRNRRRVWLSLAAAATTAAALLWPFMLAYRRVRTDVGLVRTLDEVAMFSARWTDWLATGGRLHYALWSREFFKNDALFPGILAIVLAAVAVASGVAWRDRRARMCLAIAVAAVPLSFGPAFPPYGWLYEAVPLLQGIRGAARFGQLALVGLAAVAGFGFASLLSRMTNSRWRLAMTTVVLALVTAEAWRAPLSYFEFRGIPAIYDTLAKESHAVVVHFPLHSTRSIYENTRYMLGSTRHWHPILNGYSGFVPPSYLMHLAELGGFPDDRSLRYLRTLGVTHVVLDASTLPRECVEAAARHDELRLAATDGTLSIYRFRR